MQSFQSVRGALLQVLQTLLTSRGAKNSTNDDKKWQIYVTGHSLGGTLASLCAFEIGRIKAGKYEHQNDRTSIALLPHLWRRSIPMFFSHVLVS